jgi:lipopolysaccharide/colanic/teichoic acid biosynthesis glycosyltransferase
MIKRSFDIVTSLAGLTLLSPLLLVIAVIVKMSSSGPIFYCALRIGRHEKKFKLYKFRSMFVDADKYGPGITVAGDPRVTPVGKFIRRTKMDELPQLINVLLGDMSIVGPRPEDPRYVAMYDEQQKKILSVRPGITSLASVRYRNEETLLQGSDWEKLYIEKIMPDKLKLDLEYISTQNLITDLYIILKTVLPDFMFADKLV